MKVSLTNKEADRMFAAIDRIEKDDRIKIPGQTLMDLSINKNVIASNVVAFGRSTQRLQLSIDPEARTVEARGKNLALLDEGNDLADVSHDYVLKRIDWVDLKTGENKIIDVGALAPILKGYGKAEEND